MRGRVLDPPRLNEPCVMYTTGFSSTSNERGGDEEEEDGDSPFRLPDDDSYLLVLVRDVT